MPMIVSLFRAAAFALAIALVPLTAAQAEIVLSQLIVDFVPGTPFRQDVEVWNNSDERAYVSIEGAEVIAPGTATESRRRDPDPETLGLLVSPARMILEPGERKLVRIAYIGPPAAAERVYRVAVKPVVGPVSSSQSGLKVLVGYDLLVLIRPSQPQPNVVASRSGDTATFRNIGNVSVELVDGRACDPDGKACTELPGKRLYPGAEWSEQIQPGRRGEYELKSPGQSLHKLF